MSPKTPREAWQAMVDGNHRFVSGELAHPRQDIDSREALPHCSAAPIQDSPLKSFSMSAWATFL
jgi:hypothetical protein